MKYSYLTFDCYGTLIDWRTGIERELRSALGDVRLSGQELLNAYVKAEQREESTYKKYTEVLSNTVMSMSRALGKKVGEQSAKSFAASVPRWPAFPDTRAFLREMGAVGCKRYILSNVDNDLLEGTIKNNGLEVDGYVTAQDVLSYKPNHRHWLEFLRRTGAARGQVLHAAQSVYHDIVPTQELGIESAWVNRYGDRLPDGASPTVIVERLEDLSSIIE